MQTKRIDVACDKLGILLQYLQRLIVISLRDISFRGRDIDVYENAGMQPFDVKGFCYRRYPAQRLFIAFRIVHKQLKIKLGTRVLGIKFKATFSGLFKPYEELIEEIVISDGTITKERLRFTEVPEGTKVTWTGEVVQLGRWLRILGPLVKRAFQKSVKKMFEGLGKYMKKEVKNAIR